MLRPGEQHLPEMTGEPCSQSVPEALGGPSARSTRQLSWGQLDTKELRKKVSTDILDTNQRGTKRQEEPLFLFRAVSQQ